MANQETLQGFRSSALRVGVTGAVRVAKLGSPVPKLTDKYDSEVYRNIGYISNDGVELSFDEDAQEYVPWQESLPIRRDITKSVSSVKLTLWDFGKENAEMFFGSAAQDGEDGTWYIDQAGKPDFERMMFVIDVVDGDEAMRLVLPVAQVTGREGITFKSEEAISLGITVTAYPASVDDYPEFEGKSARWMFSKSWDGKGVKSVVEASSSEDRREEA